MRNKVAGSSLRAYLEKLLSSNDFFSWLAEIKGENSLSRRRHESRGRTDWGSHWEREENERENERDGEVGRSSKGAVRAAAGARSLGNGDSGGGRKEPRTAEIMEGCCSTHAC